MTISIENEYTGDASGFPQRPEYEDIAAKVIKEALSHEKCPYEAEVNLLLTDDVSIREMNGEYRGIDRSTDVLSFPMVEYESPACFAGFDDRADLFDPDTGDLVLGDIVISIDHCVKQAEEYGHKVTREYAFLIAHSMLHLMGYDHETKDEALDMERRQEEILESLGFVR